MKTCEFCKDQYKTTDPHSRLCLNCRNIEREHIKPILGDRSYGNATDEDRAKVVERMRTNRTVKRGPFFNVKDPNKFAKKTGVWRG